jgi:tetratricopeptide (TPR) repeat protein
MTIDDAVQAGLRCQQEGRLAEAEHIYRTVLSAEPAHPPALHLLGLVLHQLGQSERGLPLLERAAALWPNNVEFHNNYGKVCQVLNRWEEAATAFRKVIELNPNHPDACRSIGVVYGEMDRLEESISSFRRFIELNPGSAGGYYNLGKALAMDDRFDEAITPLREALRIDPTYVEAANQLGRALRGAKRPAEAIEAIRHALQLRPDYAEAYNNLGAALRDCGRIEESLAACRQAVAADPSLAGARLNLAIALREVGQHEESKLTYHEALPLTQPDRSGEAMRAAIHFDLGTLHLLLGEFAKGWAEYEWRFQYLPPKERYEMPRWNGEGADGKTVLVHGEQGFGDTIQFARYLPLLREQAGRRARVIFECERPLTDLFGDLSGIGVDAVWPYGAHRGAATTIDFYFPLLSAPLLLQRHEPLSMAGPYLFAEAEKREMWREKMGPRAGIRVGLVWAGSPKHPNDRQRSMDPRILTPLLRTGSASFYSLQVGADLSHSKILLEEGLIDLTHQIRDFTDTAALLAELDLVIAVDTSVAHLAGAMGRPVWTLISHVPEWRWGLEGDRTSWYPTMRLFRQPRRGDWESVVESVASELKQVIDKGREK